MYGRLENLGGWTQKFSSFNKRVGREHKIRLDY
jgi:hypothetical protein